MSDPIVRAENGDTAFFKQVPVDQILHLRGEEQQYSVLSISVKHNHIHCSRVILQRCPSLLYHRSIDGRTALHCAAWRGIPAIVKLLIRGAEKKLFRMVDNFRGAPIMDAISQQHLETIKLLIQADPDYDVPENKNGETPLLAALSSSYGETSDHISVKIRRLLLEKQPSQCMVPVGVKRWIPLHYATSKGDIDAIQDIIQVCPESMDLIDTQGQNFLHIAVEHEHVELVEYIVREKEIAANLFNRKNGNGDTPLDIAIKTGNGKMISWLQYGLRNVVDPTIAGYENEREEELCIPPKHLKLYRDLVRHFGEIVPPHMSLSLDEFLRSVFDMLNITPYTLTAQQISFWEEKVGYYTGMGLHISWWQKHVTRLCDWLAKKNENISRLEDEIAAKEKELAQLKQLPLDFGFRLFDQLPN